MEVLPIMLNLGGRRVLVVGAGPVGRRKVSSLLEAGAAVRWVTGHPAQPGAPGQAADADHAAVADQSPDASQTACRDRLTVIERPYRDGDADGAALVFACTDDRELNSRIAADARKRGALVNAADQVDDCDFFMPAVVRDGPVVVAVGTGAQAPALAAGLKANLAAALPANIGQFAQALAVLRGELAAAVSDRARRAEIARRLADWDNYELFCREGIDALRRTMARMRKDQGSGARDGD